MLLGSVFFCLSFSCALSLALTLSLSFTVKSQHAEEYTFIAQWFTSNYMAIISFNLGVLYFLWYIVPPGISSHRRLPMAFSPLPWKKCAFFPSLAFAYNLFFFSFLNKNFKLAGIKGARRGGGETRFIKIRICSLPSWNRALYYYQGNSTGFLKRKGNTEWAINEFLQILLHSWSGSARHPDGVNNYSRHYLFF